MTAAVVTAGLTSIRHNTLTGELGRELAEAEAEERQRQREAMADQADAFADQLAKRGAVLDKMLAEFKRAYLELKDNISLAHGKGLANLNAQQVGVILAQAFRLAPHQLPLALGQPISTAEIRHDRRQHVAKPTGR